MSRTTLPASDAQRAPVFHVPWVTAFGIGFIEHPEVIEKILTHFGLWPPFPRKASRRRSEGGRRQEWEASTPYFINPVCLLQQTGPLNSAGLCEPCEEYGRLLARESLRTLPLVCSHCGQTFTEKRFERHRWNCFYRDRTLVIKANPRRR